MILSMNDHSHVHPHPYAHGTIDIYCERTSPEFWAEPINAITNGAFLIAAIMVFVFARQRGDMSIGAYSLSGLIAAIGMGSFLFHTFATFETMLMDVIPILLFQIGFLALYSRDVIGLSRLKVAVMLVAFFAVSAAFGALPREWLNGSLSYGSAFVFVLALGVYHMVTHKPERFTLFATALTFAVSLTFRSIDEALCAQIPFGTHFLWHILNGVVLYGCARTYIVAKKN